MACWRPIETEAKYAGYIAQQERQIDRLRDSESRRIPAAFEFSGDSGPFHRSEAEARAGSPGNAWPGGRIPGVTPAAVAVLDVYLSLGAHA